MTADQIGKTLVDHVTGQTARKYLKKVGICSYLALRKPLINARNSKNRFKIAKQHRNVSESELDFWAFSDEAPFELVCAKYRQRVYTTSKDRAKPHLICPRVQGGFGKVLAWGVISAHGPGPLVFIEGMVNGESYAKLARDVIIPYLFKLFDNFGEPFVFVEDNAPAHNSWKASEAFEESCANRIYWPPTSPDLNPIENVWGFINIQLSKLPRKPKNIEELKQKIRDIWESLTPDVCKRYIYSFPKRLEEVIRAKGWQNRIY
jgi:DDE superfamily endonuclease/Transposase